MTERRKKVTTQPQKENEYKPTLSKKELISQIIKKKTKEKFLSESQRKYYDILTKNQITICSGPAGVGKSYISMKAAVDLLSDPTTPYEKIIIVRPAVEAEEKLGSLPGNVEEKLDPYIFPSYYLLNKIIGKETREKLKEIEAIEVFALAYMRGMNIDNSILIFEEAQISKEAMILNVLNSMLQVTIPLRKIMISEVTDQTFRSLIEIFWKTYLSLDNLFKDFKRIIIHEGASANKHFINENAQTVPVDWFSMALIHYNFGSKILGSTADGISSFSFLDSLDESKICQF